MVKDGRVGELANAKTGPGFRAVAVVSSALLIGWVGWWVANVRRDVMIGASGTWVQGLPFLGGDFTVSIDHVARVFASGENPYNKADDWVCALFPYPPMILRGFIWVQYFSTPAALRIWLTVLAFAFAAGAYGAARTRRSLGLRPWPTAAIAAALVFSTPALLAMERAQIDPMVIPSVLLAAWLLNRRTSRAELAAGALLGLTAWLKYYPGMAVFGLLALRRGRAAIAFAAVAGGIGLVDRVDVARSMEHGVTMQKAAALVQAHPLKHSLVEDWKVLPGVRGTRLLRKIPSPVAAALLLAPAIALVSLRVGRAADPAPLVFPFLLWLAAAATFGMPYAIDYNLVPLPLAALAVWSRRDRWPIHLTLALFLLWCQPIALPIGGGWLIFVKLAALYAVGASLAARAGERAATAENLLAWRAHFSMSKPTIPSTLAQSRS